MAAWTFGLCITALLLVGLDLVAEGPPEFVGTGLMGSLTRLKPGDD